MATAEVTNREMLALKELLDDQTEAMRETLGHGALLRMKELKKVRAQMVTAGLDVTEVDRDMDLLKGTKETKGLFFVLDVSDDGASKKKKAAEDVGEQRSADDERDFSSHPMTSEQFREHVGTLVTDEKLAAAAKVLKLNALEDGEREREGGARETHLKIIRGARTPLVKKVKQVADSKK